MSSEKQILCGGEDLESDSPRISNPVPPPKAPWLLASVCNMWVPVPPSQGCDKD